MYCFIKWHICKKRTNIKRAHYFVVMFVSFGPICRTNGVLVGGNRLKYANKERSQIVIVGVDRGNNGAERASGFVNLWKAIQNTRR